MRLRSVAAALAVAAVAAVGAAALVHRQPAAPRCAPARGTRAVLFRVARVFDGERVAPATDVLVVDGVVSAVGTIACVDATGGAPVEEVDARGATLLPGLIDAHAHGSDDEASLAEAISFGVTTEIDMGGAMGTRLAEIRAKDDPKLADAIGAGMYVTCPGGHGTEYGHPVPTLARADDAAAFVDARVAEGSQFIKLIISSGMPKLGPDEAAAVVAAAHARDRIVVSHVNTRADAEVAVAAGVDGLAHLFLDRRNGHLWDGTPVAWDPLAAQQLAERIAARHVFVIPTLEMLQMMCGTATGRPLLADARIAPRLTERARALLDAGAWSDSDRDCYAHVVESVGMLNGAVPILAGTDTPNDGATHGASLHREMELLVDAGLTPIEALRAATSAPARAFAPLRDRGRIAVGARADLLLVDGDPTSDILATRAILRVYKRGAQSM
jgi:imidazolonepropionase-like amidohydrolase